MRQTATDHVRGRVDAHGCLIEADPRLHSLQRQAGGSMGDVIAVPALAATVHLAQNLQTPVARTILAAEGEGIYRLHVTATPDSGLVELEISQWDCLPRAAQAFGIAYGDEAREWRFICDSRLHLIRVWCEHAPPGIAEQNLGSVFRFEPDDTGNAPIYAALAQQISFVDQAARFGVEAEHCIVDAVPMFDEKHHCAGWRGRVRFLAGSNKVPEASSIDGIASALHSDMAHETRLLSEHVRAGLEVILGHSDAMAAHNDGALSDRYTDYARDISAASRHLLGLIVDVNDAAALDTPDFKVDCETLDLAEVAGRAASLLRVRADDVGVKIDAPGSDEVMLVKGDFRRLLQIVINILGNAVRYSPPGATIWMRCEREGDLAALVIADQGKGIAPEQHSRIFDRFYRVDPSELGGSGLGLYISRKLARAMGGDITVDSAPGQGARFILTLPAA